MNDLEGEYLLEIPIAYPFISKRIVDIASRTRTDAISQCAPVKGCDQVRFELRAYAFKPGIKGTALWAEGALLSREKLLTDAEKHDIPVGMKHKRGDLLFSMDANLPGIGHESCHIGHKPAETEESIGRSTDSLFDSGMATFEDDADACDQEGATGLMRQNSLHMRSAANQDKHGKMEGKSG